MNRKDRKVGERARMLASYDAELFGKSCLDRFDAFGDGFVLPSEEGG